MIHEDMRAKIDAIKHEERERQRDLGPIPDPKEIAWHLPESIVATLTSPQCILRNSYCATEAVAAVLRPYGLCEYPTRISKGWGLTNFGCAVLKELIEGGR